MSSAVTLSQFWERVQRGLFGWLEAELGELSGKQKQLVKILELLRVEEHVQRRRLIKGRPLEDRKAIARAFVAKAVYNLETTRQRTNAELSSAKARAADAKAKAERTQELFDAKLASREELEKIQALLDTLKK